MNDPRFRFMLLISLIVGFSTFGIIIYTFVGGGGLNIFKYINGIKSLTLSTLSGVLFVWACTKFITFAGFKKTGFEGTVRDDSGTQFFLAKNGKLEPAEVALTKFVPEIIAPPLNESLHPLEQELLGFLNCFKTWPYDITGNTSKTLYQHSIEQWQAMQRIPNTGYMHRAAALAQDLGKVWAYQEHRKSYSWQEFWKQDEVYYSRRCDEHGGLSAFVLSTMPSFKTIGDSERQKNKTYRRAILTAIRYKDDPTSIPANCDPLAKEIYEALHRAYQISSLDPKVQEKFEPSAEEVEVFNNEVSSYIRAAIKDLEVSPVSITDKNDGVYMGDGKIIVKISSMTKSYAKVLSPAIRGAFKLWEIDNQQHPSWEYFIRRLRSLEMLVEDYKDTKANNGLFNNIRVNGVNFLNAMIIDIPERKYADLRSKLDSMPKWSGVVEIQQSEDTLASEVKEKSSQLDAMLQKAYSM